MADVDKLNIDSIIQRLLEGEGTEAEADYINRVGAEATTRAAS